MKYNEMGFRAIYGNLCIIPMKEGLAELLEGFPGAEEADRILTYGYIDHEGGLTLEILAAGIKGDGDSMTFFDGRDDVTAKIRIERVEDDEITLLEDDELRQKHAAKIAQLATYEASEDIKKSREMSILDGIRHASCIDDVMVHLVKDGLGEEVCWARIEGLGDHFFVGDLMNEPFQDFGYHAGERIGFYLDRDDRGRIIAISDMNPSMRLTPKDLEDGSMLADAIRLFNEERTEAHWIDVMELLRDSCVWIPCSAVLSEADEGEIMRMINEAKDDLDSLIGSELTSSEEVRLIPELLQNGDDLFFPVFSSVSEMGEFAEGSSTIQEHMLTAVDLARNSGNELQGIVVNAFTDSFIVPMELADVLEKMKSRIVRQ